MRSESVKTWKKLFNSPPQFKYPPLSPRQIRILTLHPGRFDSPIVITLQERDLCRAENAYEALSYVWGDPTRKTRIECNSAELLITTSLEIALRRLRFPNARRMLWVDAICINQDDLEERARQVPFMKEIYPKADKVLVWLGEADKKDELAIDAINKWADFNGQYRYSSDATRFAKFEERFAHKPGYRDTLEAAGALTYRPWFNRCWTFQEILLSTNAEILVGEFHLTWECFYHALKAFPIHLLADDVLNFNALFMCHGKAKISNMALAISKASSTKTLDADSTPVSRNLSRVLQITRNFTASDPRDKIFSVLSVALMKNPSNFLPNYSMSVRDTFISLTLAMIRDENSLNVLISTGEQKRDKSLPSWCPDWNSSRGVTLTGYYDYISYDVNAGLHHNLSNLQMNKDFELELEGALIDVVKEVYDLDTLGDELKASLKEPDFTSVLSRFARKIGLQNCKLQDDLSPEAILLRTLSADHWFFGAHLRDSYKEIWFPTHLRFRHLKRNIPRLNRQSFSHNSHHCMGVKTAPSLNLKKQNHQSNNAFVLDLPTDTSNLRQLDYEIDNPFTHAVIDKVYLQSSPFYIKGQDFEGAKNIDAPTLVAIAREAVSQAHFFFRGKRILITKRGFVGIGPDKTRVGDSLCSFWGADIPFVIREKKKKRTDCTNLFEIIGESYIDGIMYGELFRVISKARNSSYEETIQPLVNWIQFRTFKIA